MAGVVKVMPWLRPLYQLLPSAKVAANFRQFATEQFLARLKKSDTGDDADVFHYLLEDAPDGKFGKPLTKTELGADSSLVILAG